MKQFRMFVFFFMVGLLAIAANRARAEIRLPHLLSDHGVLQRGAPIHIWGWNTPKGGLKIRFHNQEVSATSNKYGEWSAWLMPEQAGGPYTLTIYGGHTDEKKEVTDLLVGDVWIASGQSNMQMPLAGFLPDAPLKDSAKEIAAASIPSLRLLVVGMNSSDMPQQDINGTWSVCTPKSAAWFSAVTYFFGREIVAKENIPVGLIDASVGGTPADSWVSLDTLGSNPALVYVFRLRAEFAQSQIHESQQILAEKAEDATAVAAGLPKPKHMWHANETTWIPAGLYNGMIAPLAEDSIKGFLWYQGENEAKPERAPQYSVMLPALIQDWRTHFQQGNLPFLIVQITSHQELERPGWSAVRDAERRTLSVANTALAVTLDVGDRNTSHPPDKQTVGARLALAARGMVYGEKVPYASPLFRQATTEPGAMRVWFDNAEGLTTHDKLLDDFELAGADHHFVPATAKIENNTVVVSAKGLENPVYVRYAWESYVEHSLYNSAGLPASTFTSEPVPTL
jgi:sialate O-acetylesterase